MAAAERAGPDRERKRGRRTPAAPPAPVRVPPAPTVPPAVPAPAGPLSGGPLPVPSAVVPEPYLSANPVPPAPDARWGAPIAQRRPEPVDPRTGEHGPLGRTHRPQPPRAVDEGEAATAKLGAARRHRGGPAAEEIQLSAGPRCG